MGLDTTEQISQVLMQGEKVRLVFSLLFLNCRLKMTIRNRLGQRRYKRFSFTILFFSQTIY